MRVVTDSLKVSLLCHSDSDYFYECDYDGISFFIYVHVDGLNLQIHNFLPVGVEIPQSVLDSFLCFILIHDVKGGVIND